MDEFVGSTANFNEVVLAIIDLLRPLSVEHQEVFWNYASFVYKDTVILRVMDESIVFPKKFKFCFHEDWNNQYFLNIKDLRKLGFKQVKTISFEKFMANKQILVEYVQNFIKFKKEWDIKQLKDKLNNDFKKPSLIDRLFRTQFCQTIFKQLDEISRG